MDSVPVMNGSTRPLDGEDGAEGQSQPNVVQERGKEDARDEGVDRELDATHSVQEEPVEHNKQTLDHTSENSTFANGNLDVAVNARGDSAENQSHVSERPSLDDRHHSHLHMAQLQHPVSAGVAGDRRRPPRPDYAARSPAGQTDVPEATEKSGKKRRRFRFPCF